jgi:hypothetical protein
MVFIGLDEKNNSEHFVKIDKVTANFGILPDKKFVAHITLEDSA